MKQRITLEGILRLALVALAGAALISGLAAWPATSAAPASATPTAPATATPSATPSPSATPTPAPTTTPGPPTATPTPLHAPAVEPAVSLSVPALALEAPIVSVPLASVPALSAAVAARAEDGPLPGHPGNLLVVISTGVATALDADWAQLRAGDALYLGLENSGSYRYLVDKVLRPLPGADLAAWTAATDEQRLTLIVGWPGDAPDGCWVFLAYPAPWADEP